MKYEQTSLQSTSAAPLVSDQWLESICNKTHAAEMSLVNLLFLNSTGNKHGHLVSCQLDSENSRRVIAGQTGHSAIQWGQNKGS